MTKKDFIAEAHENAAAEKAALEREIASDSRRRYFRRDTTGFKEAFIGALADAMASFWIAVFPFVLVGGIGAFALSSWLGISLWAGILGVALLTIMVFAFFNSFS